MSNKNNNIRKHIEDFDTKDQSEGKRKNQGIKANK
jgi:hypothetical protein